MEKSTLHLETMGETIWRTNLRIYKSDAHYPIHENISNANKKEEPNKEKLR